LRTVHSCWAVYLSENYVLAVKKVTELSSRAFALKSSNSFADRAYSLQKASELFMS